MWVHSPPSADTTTPAVPARQRPPASAFINALISGRLPWKAYADLLAQQFFVHESLAQAAEDMAGDPVAGAFILPAPARLPALAADLRFLRGPGWPAQIAASSATTTYCTRLRDTAFHDPTGFAAHYVTRHLDDLRAARQLGPAVAAAYGLDCMGRRFYAYDEDLHLRYAGLIDGHLQRPGDEAMFSAEAGYARRLHAAVLDELGRKWA
jgi:heme oxygenase